MTTFIERMQCLANDKDAVQKTYADEYLKKKNARKDQLFKTLTFKYYDEIKKSIENASKHGRQYAYMNFDRDDFKANFNGLGSPAQFQRLWLIELCNPDSKYLKLYSWEQPNIRMDNWYKESSNVANGIVYASLNHPSGSAFNNNTASQIRDSFKGLNYDVWNNAKFTTVFSWDSGINNRAMSHYHTRHWQDEIFPIE